MYRSPNNTEKKRPKIIFVSPEVPYPLNSGIKIRIYHLLESISQWGIVEMVCFIKDEQDKENLAGIQHFCEKIHCFNLPPSLEPQRKLRLLKKLKMWMLHYVR